MRYLAVLALVCALAVACGREDVELGQRTPPTGLDPAARARCEAGTVVALGCRGVGAGCSVADECCSARCEAGRCLPAACGAPGVTCATRADCCSGLCEPTPGTTTRTCLDYCRPEGTPCGRPGDCCSFACIGGTCAAGACLEQGKDCASAAECCSGSCPNGKCERDENMACKATGEECRSQGGRGCCGACVADRCDLGPGPCRSRGTTCTIDGDCCAGTCAGPAGARSCQSACAADGATCALGSDCCGGQCSGSPQRCGAPKSQCLALGEKCGLDTECCAGLCGSGVCQDCRSTLR